MTITPDLHVGLPFLEGLCADLRRSLAVEEVSVPKFRPLRNWRESLRISLTIAGGIASAALALLEFSSSL